MVMVFDARQVAQAKACGYKEERCRTTKNRRARKAFRWTCTVRRSRPCWKTGRVRDVNWQLGAFRGNGACRRMPGDAWETQVANGVLAATCARVLANAATKNRRAAGTRRPRRPRHRWKTSVFAFTRLPRRRRGSADIGR
jgi:hypothetical protein